MHIWLSTIENCLEHGQCPAVICYPDGLQLAICGGLLLCMQQHAKNAQRGMSSAAHSMAEVVEVIRFSVGLEHTHL